MTPNRIAALSLLLLPTAASAGFVEEVAVAEAEATFLVDGSTCTRSISIADVLAEALAARGAEREAALSALAEGLACVTALDHARISEALALELFDPTEPPEALLPVALLWSDVGRHGPIGEALRAYLIANADELEPLLAAGTSVYGYQGEQLVALDPELAFQWTQDFVAYGDSALHCGILETFAVEGHRVCEWDCRTAAGDERLPEAVVTTCTAAVAETNGTIGGAWTGMPAFLTCAIEHGAPDLVPCLVERQLQRAIQPLGPIGLPQADRWVASRDCQLMMNEPPPPADPEPERPDLKPLEEEKNRRELDAAECSANPECSHLTWLNLWDDYEDARRDYEEAEYKHHLWDEWKKRDEARRKNFPLGFPPGLVSCDSDDPSGCSTSCGIRDQSLQDLQYCFDQEHGEALPDPTPDPADPRVILPDPLVPPDVASEFLDCIIGAATPNEGTCDDALDCANGEEPEENALGLCVCPSDAAVFDPHERCDQAILCEPDQPCGCTGPGTTPFGPDGLPFRPGTLRFLP